jgi:hypothetical protein
MLLDIEATEIRSLTIWDLRKGAKAPKGIPPREGLEYAQQCRACASGVPSGELQEPTEAIERQSAIWQAHMKQYRAIGQ